MVYWFSRVNPHTRTMKMGSNPPLIHGKRERGRGRELWCVNGCSRPSHPGLFFSSLTQQSISSLLEGLVLDSSWHVPPSLRARDEGARCAECSNIAHTHLFATWGGGKKTGEKTQKWDKEREEWIKMKMDKMEKNVNQNVRRWLSNSTYLLSWNFLLK